MTDTSRRRLQLDQAVGGVAVDAASPVRRNVLEQRVADEAVAEPVADARGLDDARGERVVEVVERVVFGQPGQRDELVGVERRADDRDALQHLPRGRGDAADHVGVEACTQRGSLAARRASSFTANGMPRPSAAICSTSSGAGSARGGRRAWRRRRRRADRARVSVAPWRSIRLSRVSAERALAGAGRCASTMHTR